MKKTLLLTIFLCFSVSLVEAQSIKLPNECKSILDINFRGWKLAKIQKDISAYHKKRKFPFEPNLIKGDWNGDGKIDYAILIEHKKKAKTVAFVGIQNKFKHFLLEGGDYIQIFKKGANDYNYDSQKGFKYKNDAIFVGSGECCGSSYIWRKEKFIGIVTSD